MESFFRRRSPGWNRLLLIGLGWLAGCLCYWPERPADVEAHVAAVASLRSVPTGAVAIEPVPLPPATTDLATFWNLALVNNPDLRETSARLEAACGRLIQ